MKKCFCTKLRISEHDNILLKTNSIVFNGKILSDFYCIQCGNHVCMQHNPNLLFIDIEELNVPVTAICQEFDIVYKSLIPRFDYNNVSLSRNITLIYNIMQAIIWAYEIDYYKEFDNYLFKDVRSEIIDYFAGHSFERNFDLSFFFNNFDDYLLTIKDNLANKKHKPFNLISALSDPNVFTSQNTILYGPAACIFNNYIDTRGISRKSNNFYYSSDKYFWGNREALVNEASEVRSKIVAILFNYIITNCVNIELNSTNFETLDDLRQMVNENNFGKNEIILSGFLDVFGEVLECDQYTYISSRTYKEYLQKLKEAMKFVTEHV